MEPLAEPRKLLAKAKKCLYNIGQSSSLEQQQEHWVEFLHILERLWNKAEYELRRYEGYENWPKRIKINKLRKQDELLRYLKNARDVDEHSDSPITKVQPGGLGINPLFGDELSFNMSFGSGGKISTFHSNVPVKVDLIPDTIKPIDVTNRSGKHSPPTSHLGQPIIDQSLSELARLGLSFYTDYLNEAERVFVKKEVVPSL